MMKRMVVIGVLCNLLIGTAALAENLSNGGNIPISGIFVTETTDQLIDAEADGTGKAQSAAMAGLLVSVFIVIGAGRTYAQLHQNVHSALAVVTQQRKQLVRDSVKIRDDSVRGTLEQCETLKGELVDLQYQLEQFNPEMEG